MIQNLDVFLWGRKVGTLVTYKERYAEKICFYYDSDFLNAGYDIAPLRASINSPSVRNGLPVYADSDKLFGGLPSFIADSLPDHWGNRVFNEQEGLCDSHVEGNAKGGKTARTHRGTD